MCSGWSTCLRNLGIRVSVTGERVTYETPEMLAEQLFMRAPQPPSSGSSRQAR